MLFTDSQTIHTEHLLTQGHLCRYPTLTSLWKKKDGFSSSSQGRNRVESKHETTQTQKTLRSRVLPQGTEQRRYKRGCEGGELLFLLPRESKKVPPQVSSRPPQENRGSEGLQEEGWGSDHGGWEEPKSGKAASSVDQATEIGSLIFASLHPSFFGKQWFYFTDETSSGATLASRGRCWEGCLASPGDKMGGPP